MTKFLLPMLWMIALAPFSALHAQDMTGTWQGTLNAAGKELRIVMKISKADDGSLKAVMYSIDQGGQPMTGGVTQQGSGVKIAVPGIGGTYEGKLSSDGVLLNGTWTQGPMPLSLNLTRTTADTAWTIPEALVRLPPMAADANPSFEVATIKPSNPDTPGKLFRVMPGRFSTLNTTMDDLITWAYGIHPKQITGAPSWFETEKFDLAGQPDGEGQPNAAQWKTML